MVTVKISLKELKKALAILEAESRDLSLKFAWEPEKLKISGFDKLGRSIEITLFDERIAMLPIISRTESL